jgi:hypothetical protein
MASNPKREAVGSTKYLSTTTTFHYASSLNPAIPTMEFFVDIILPIALWTWGRLSL